jgi:F-type H+-transporting ATPase subunit b
MPQLDMSTWPPQLFWLAVTFIILYFVISRIFIPRTGGAIALRKSTIEADLASAQKFRLESEEAVKSYEKALAEAKNKASVIIAESRNALNAEVESEKSKLDEALNAKIAAGEKSVAQARDKALQGVAGMAAEMASQIVEQLIDAKVTKTAAASAVSRLLGK